MEAPRNSLNAHLSWPHTAALLGLPLADEALPARLDCPLCGHRRLHVYPDVLCGGAWFACPDCGRCGDLIELAAGLWGMGLHATLQHLAYLGAPLPREALVPERVADYVRDYPSYRQRLNTLWEQARAWLPQARSPALNRLRSRMLALCLARGPRPCSLSGTSATRNAAASATRCALSHASTHLHPLAGHEVSARTTKAEGRAQRGPIECPYRVSMLR